MLKIYNTLTRKVEEFTSLKENKVTMYSCGPTVYDYQHIGHMRRYVGDDILIRVLQWNGYNVKHAMNITDVGHLVSDSDSGEDKMEKGAKKFGKSVWDIAKMFEEQFKDSCQALNIVLPKDLMHATDYIKEQIALIEVLEKKGYTYKIADGIYFDTSKFKDYFKLSHQNPEELKKGARVEFVQGKKNVSDFALWKFENAYNNDGYPARAMNWWFEGKNVGDLIYHRTFSKEDLKKDLHRFLSASDEERKTIGFPGWHIECSAMAMKALGETLDIHTGGIDHIAIHHTNEIAQAEAATGKEFVRFWVHHNFLVVDGQKMSKSLGNFYTVQDVTEKGFDPMALRYLYLQTHYRQEMNFTWESLQAAQTAYIRLIHEFKKWKKTGGISDQEYLGAFTKALNDDLNTAKAMSILWEMVKSDIPEEVKATTLADMDGVLGLGILEKEVTEAIVVVPSDVQALIDTREALRKAGDYGAADEIRKKIFDLGFTIEDSKDGSKITKK